MALRIYPNDEVDLRLLACAQNTKNIVCRNRLGFSGHAAGNHEKSEFGGMLLKLEALPRAPADPI